MYSVNKFNSFSVSGGHLALAFILVIQAIITTQVVDCLNFSYYPNFPDVTHNDFSFLGKSQRALGFLQVTYDVRGAPISNLAGRILYKSHLFHVWSKKKNITASFNSTFVINITPQTAQAGEGLSFILTDSEIMPDNSEGQWLGIVNLTTNGSSVISPIVAIEFDTKKSYSEDLDDNHVGVDVNSIYSLQQASLSPIGVSLSSGQNVVARVQYDGELRKLDVFVSMDDETGNLWNEPVISMPIDLSSYLSEFVYVGFSGSTGENDTQLNCIKSWNFTSHEIDNPPNGLLTWIVVPVVVIVALAGLLACCLMYHRKRRKTIVNDDEYPDFEQAIQNSATSPHKFQLKELRLATGNFSPKSKLGEGGFGSVYKGLLVDKRELAVKRVSKDSRQGKQEFLAEVTTIGNLRHKNLVTLIGWCYEDKELILVYEFMPNGSLDKLIFGADKKKCDEDVSPILSWDKRHGIIFGVAQALDYLHNGLEKRVLHRDIKSSNIMLDKDYNARLGDFGLARTIRLSEITHYSTKEIAGTPGYMAPEIFHTGRATAETDVYAFGVLMLEVSTGRKPGNFQNEQINRNAGIVEWIWDLHRREKVIDAADHRLEKNFVKEQIESVLVLGLACCHPNPCNRPSMRTVMQVLTGEISPPDVPIEKPAFIWPVTPNSFSFGLDYSVGGGGQITPFSDLSGR